MVTVYRVVWRDCADVLHTSAPRFYDEDAARRFVEMLERDPSVTETRIVRVVLRPILPLPLRPA